MPFVVPTFPLICGIWDGPEFPGGDPEREVVECNLAIGRRGYPTFFQSGPLVSTTFGINPILLVPAGTDIRDQSTGQNGDIVEVPSGSGRYYSVSSVDDVGKGFPNEFRIAVLMKAHGGVSGLPPSWNLEFWPIPIP